MREPDAQGVLFVADKPTALPRFQTAPAERGAIG
jgi:hypothetical protein